MCVCVRGGPSCAPAKPLGREARNLRHGDRVEGLCPSPTPTMATSSVPPAPPVPKKAPEATLGRTSCVVVKDLIDGETCDRLFKYAIEKLNDFTKVEVIHGDRRRVQLREPQAGNAKAVFANTVLNKLKAHWKETGVYLGGSEEYEDPKARIERSRLLVSIPKGHEQGEHADYLNNVYSSSKFIVLVNLSDVEAYFGNGITLQKGDCLLAGDQWAHRGGAYKKLHVRWHGYLVFANQRAPRNVPVP